MISHTMMTILVLNSGSSSLRFALYRAGEDEPITSGHAECLNSAEANISIAAANGEKSQKLIPIADHAAALRSIIDELRQGGVLESDPDAVGHRIVHGGESFSAPALIDDEVVARIEACSNLAPLHNPSGLLGIEVARELFEGVAQVAVFDTAFHSSLPAKSYLYALPYSLYEDHAVRRYGFHGSSHAYVTKKAAQLLGMELDNSRFISMHLGNGCSAAAVLNGKSVETSMGFTPMEGLVMGTRCGDVDPGVLLYLQTELNLSGAEISDLLNRQSGLLGVSGVSNDMRQLRSEAEAGNQRAALAIEIFCYRAAKTAASLMVALGGVGHMIFTGGIGENDARARALILKQLSYLGYQLDDALNRSNGAASQGLITAAESRCGASVIETREELMIAQLASETLNRHR